jgi:hypothetical protein
MESRPSGTGLLPPPLLLPPGLGQCDDDDGGGAVVVLGLSARGAAVGGGGNLGFRGLRGRLTGTGWRRAGGVGVAAESFCGELMPPVGPGVFRAGARLEGDSGGPKNKKRKMLNRVYNDVFPNFVPHVYKFLSFRKFINIPHKGT